MKHTIIYPPALSVGDKVRIISPSGSIDKQYIEGAKHTLQTWGLEVEVAPHAAGRYGRFGGTAEQRLCDIQDAMDDEQVKMILCSRGGYGAVHLLESIDFTKIKKNPKWLVGYSDITALHLLFMQNGLASIHAPMAKHLALDADNESSIYLKDILMNNKVINYNRPFHELNIKGDTEGCLFGGNLSVLAGLIGTPYTQVPKNGILFIEDIGERPYQIDRILWNLKLAGILKQIKGLVVGQFTDYEEDPLMPMTVYENIRAMVSEYNIPVCFDFPVGHVRENYPLVHGGQYFFEVSEKETNLCLNS
ncbi:muramoyltetrapeptide carboxypeptidase [Dysgonomonas sp. PH5-45]|uniref:S66 peptidase family protein n=1 Tax=unclassified Dysgonomonas TaxID=2630389 RepID=UPI00247572EE|nr:MULTISPECIES: LD-carboxypeptidase [unclassified Dysgonomonas]MDH6355388.1 muramoyltetrapeptide carboxypeptidase [Dysgonomonas sp. PH5-45]MDH6388286.1 muramoyltetrapeptide carboxypeptidase [Dysgonomonas sp. PH5-37]